MSKLPTKHWAEMGWRDFAAADMREVVAVLPVAAIEQHGHHLPVGTDSFINQGHLDRVIARTPADLPVLFLPAQTMGLSSEHAEYPGTLTFSPETLIRAWGEIGDGVARAGCRKLIFINAHGGNVAIIDVVARELRLRHAMLAVQAAWGRFGVPEGMYSDAERAHGIHGGDKETSLMLAFRPETVKRTAAANFPSAAAGIERDNKRLRATQPVGFGWLASDLNESGAVGDASAASAAKGEATAEVGVAGFLELLADVAAFDLETLRPGPLAGQR